MVARERGGGEMNRQSTENFEGNKHILYEIIMIDICHYTFI